MSPAIAGQGAETSRDLPQTLGGMLRRTAQLYPDRPAHMEAHGSEYVSLSFSELYRRVYQVARALHALGLRSGDRLALLGENSSAWAQVDWAAQSLGLVTVPIYPTLTPAQARYIASDSGCKAAIVGSEALGTKLEDLPELRVVTFEELDHLVSESTLEREAWEAGIEGPGGEAPATIIYTSGTTGEPKGAVLPHRAFVSLAYAAPKSLPVNEHDVFLSYLPLSHVYERMAGHVLPMAIGACVAYSGGAAKLASDLIAVRPTIFLAVPRLLEAIQGRILDAIRKQPWPRRAMFHWALDQGTKRSQARFAPFAGILDRIVGEKIRARTGGRMRFFVSGGAALPAHVAQFYLAFRLTVLQGYGLTETCGANCVNHPDRNDPSTVGEPLEGVEIRIASDGEILIRGQCVMKEYYHLPDATAAAIDSEGWFHTGDIGEMVGGKLKITDRKKDILVLGNGKNVAPQPIENRLRESEWIAEAVLFGDGMEQVVALIVPDLARYEALKEEVGGDARGIRELVQEHIKHVNSELADYERVRRFDLLETPFSIESGELTPTLKVRRKVVAERYADRIAALTR
jgi:long-chain acyl-CoA synthetase